MASRLLSSIAVLALVVAACGGSDDSPAAFGEDTIAIWVNRDLGVATERVLVAVVEPDGTRLGDPSKPVTIEVSPQDDPGALQAKPAGFTWSVEGAIGFYRADFDFTVPGIWELTVVPDDGDPLGTILIQVRDDACREPGATAPCAPRIGEKAPSLATPTLSDLPIEELTTDASPDPRLYELSLDELLSNGRPGVIVFATPAYCQTAACGPIVQNIKPVVDEFPGVDFLHIEVYTDLLSPDFAPDVNHLAPALTAWSLPTEPWVFVVDEEGVVTARFEGAMGTDELRSHL